MKSFVKEELMKYVFICSPYRPVGEDPAGCRVKLLEMDDIQAPPIGTEGTVVHVDDTGSICVRWDTGSGLNVIYGVDRCVKI